MKNIEQLMFPVANIILFFIQYFYYMFIKIYYVTIINVFIIVVILNICFTQIQNCNFWGCWEGFCWNHHEAEWIKLNFRATVYSFKRKMTEKYFTFEGLKFVIYDNVVIGCISIWSQSYKTIWLQVSLMLHYFNLY